MPEPIVSDILMQNVDAFGQSITGRGIEYLYKRHKREFQGEQGALPWGYREKIPSEDGPILGKCWSFRNFTYIYQLISPKTPRCYFTLLWSSILGLRSHVFGLSETKAKKMCTAPQTTRKKIRRTQKICPITCSH